jgi:hypothetical protein
VIVVEDNRSTTETPHIAAQPPFNALADLAEIISALKG